MSEKVINVVECDVGVGGGGGTEENEDQFLV